MSKGISKVVVKTGNEMVEEVDNLKYLEKRLIQGSYRKRIEGEKKNFLDTKITKVALFQY